jgi:hypothetical protein
MTKTQALKNLEVQCRSVREDVTELTYHRPPTKGEIRFGHGAIHYRTFTVEECFHEGTRIPKKWFKADDGLRYTR